MDLEAISRDLGEPNLFLTVNMDARAWPDVRQLIHELEFGVDVPFDKNWGFADSEQYTELMAKYGPQVSIYLCRKVKIFLRAFLHDICRCGDGERKIDSKTGQLLTSSKQVGFGVESNLRNSWGSTLALPREASKRDGYLNLRKNYSQWTCDSSKSSNMAI